MKHSMHKFHGPKELDLFIYQEDIQINPFLRGGGQERNMGNSTENIYGKTCCKT